MLLGHRYKYRGIFYWKIYINIWYIPRTKENFDSRMVVRIFIFIIFLFFSIPFLLLYNTIFLFSPNCMQCQHSGSFARSYVTNLIIKCDIVINLTLSHFALTIVDCKETKLNKLWKMFKLFVILNPLLHGGVILTTDLFLLH